MLQSLVLAALATAVTARKCRDLTIPISISAENVVFDLKPPATDIDVTDFALRVCSQGSNYTNEIAKGTKIVHGDYKIAATYCEPNHGPGHSLQIMTHGLGFDRSYWDWKYNNYNYSYVAEAVDTHGYSTFTWDRLGVGHSSKGDAVNEIQNALEVAALTELTKSLRAGTVPGITTKYNTTAHVGHSFGSTLTYAFSNANPTLTNSIVLTGFSQNPTYVADFCFGSNFASVKCINSLAKSYPAGYIASATEIGVQTAFFAPGDFDPAVLAGAFKAGQAIAVGEILTIGAGVGVANFFPGSVYIITGEFDIPFCGGNCLGTSSINSKFPDLVAGSVQAFPKASVFNSTIVTGTGHGLNLAYSAKSTYAHIFDFLGSHL